MTDTDHSGTDPRPPLEEFIRLTSEPGCSWGMADSDVVEICEYALRLETRLSVIRRETLLEAAKVADERVAENSKTARSYTTYTCEEDSRRHREAVASSGTAAVIAARIRALAGEK